MVIIVRKDNLEIETKAKTEAKVRANIKTEDPTIAIDLKVKPAPEVSPTVTDHKVKDLITTDRVVLDLNRVATGHIKVKVAIDNRVATDLTRVTTVVKATTDLLSRKNRLCL